MRAPQAYPALGLVLVAGCALLGGFGANAWPQLREWQAGDAFKLTTGFLLLSFMIGQSLLTLTRSLVGLSAHHAAAYRWHLALGWLGVPLVWMHASRYGFGHQLVLWGSFLLNAALGFVAPSLIGVRHRAYLYVWMIAHVALSVFVAGLALFHVWVALSFH